MPGMNLAQMFAQNQGNAFSGNYNNYQPALRPMQANPLAQGVQQGNPKGTATLGGINNAMGKVAMSRGLGDVPTGVGPQQMNAALAQLGQARALVDPSGTLQEKGLSREDFDDKITELAGRDDDKYNFSEMRKDPQTNSIIKGLIGAIAGGGLGYLGGGIGGGLAGAGLGGAGGAGIGYLGAQNENRKLHDTAKVLKEYGLLKPEYLRQALPLLKAGSQDNNAQRLSSAGESSGVAFKHDDEGHATGASAFDTLDGYMKKAGLNSFQTQFFSRLIGAGMSESLVASTVKVAGDWFGAEVHAELQDGLEKLAKKKLNVFEKSAKGDPTKKVRNVANFGKALLGQTVKQAPKTVKQAPKNVGPAMGRNLPRQTVGEFGEGIFKKTPRTPQSQGMANYVEAVKGTAPRQTAGQQVKQQATQTAQRAAPQATQQATQAAQKAAPQAAQQATQAAQQAAPSFAQNAAGRVGDYVGSKTLRDARRNGFSSAFDTYRQNLSRGFAGRAGTGAFYGATDPSLAPGYQGSDNTSLYSLAPTLWGGKVPENFNAPGMAVNTAAGALMSIFGGPAVQRAMFRGGAGQGVGEALEVSSPWTGWNVPGAAQWGRNIGTVSPNRMPVFRNGRLVNTGTELGTGYMRTGKAKRMFDKDMGIIDRMDPANWASHLIGRGYSAAKKNPVVAASIATPAIAAGAGLVANNTANQIRADVNAEVAGARGDAQNAMLAALEMGTNVAQETKNELIENAPEIIAEASTQVTQPLIDKIKEFGGSVTDFADNLFPGAGEYLQQNWPLLLAGVAVGGIGGAALGGSKGGLLGGLGVPLALMFAQSQGLLPPMGGQAGTAGQGGAGGQGQQDVGQAAAQATNLAGDAESGTRNELEASQYNPPQYQEGNGPLLSYANPQPQQPATN